MLNTIKKTIFLDKEIHWNDFEYPNWYAYIIIAVIALLQTYSPTFDEMEVDFFVGFLFNLISTLIGFIVLTWLVQRYMNEEGCDSKGKMFRLVIAVSVINILVVSLMSFSPYPLSSIVVIIFSFWIATNALVRVCNVTFGYALKAVIISYIWATILMVLLGVVFGVVGAMTGIMTIPQPS